MFTNVLLQAPYWEWPGPWHMGWMGGGVGWLFPILMVVFMVALCVFIARAQWHPHDHTGSALQMLGERFAKGEITKEEFEEKRATLVRRA